MSCAETEETWPPALWNSQEDPDQLPHSGWLEAKTWGIHWESIQTNSFQEETEKWVFLLAPFALRLGRIIARSSCTPIWKLILLFNMVLWDVNAKPCWLSELGDLSACHSSNSCYLKSWGTRCIDLLLPRRDVGNLVSMLELNGGRK